MGWAEREGVSGFSAVTPTSPCNKGRGGLSAQARAIDAEQLKRPRPGLLLRWSSGLELLVNG